MAAKKTKGTSARKSRAKKAPKKTKEEEVAAQEELLAKVEEEEPAEEVETDQGDSEAGEKVEASAKEPQEGDAEEITDAEAPEEEAAEVDPAIGAALLARIEDLERRARESEERAKKAEQEKEAAVAAMKNAAAPLQQRPEPGLTSRDFFGEGERNQRPKDEPRNSWAMAANQRRKCYGDELGKADYKVLAQANREPRKSEIALHGDDSVIYVAEFRRTSDSPLPVAMVPRVVYEQMRSHASAGNYIFVG